VPGVEQIEPLLGFAPIAGILAVDVEAVGTAVNLRSTHFNEFDQALL
jgi:ABC-type phosphate/phosphonate transport system permease subunit